MSFNQNFFEIPDQFTNNAFASLLYAAKLAQEMDNQYLSTEHLLLGILKQTSSKGAKMLEEVGVNYDRLRLALNMPVSPQKTDSKPDDNYKQFTKAAEQAIRYSLNCVEEYNQDACGTEHILFSILLQSQSKATKTLEDMNVDIHQLAQMVETVLHQQGFNGPSFLPPGKFVMNKRPVNRRNGTTLEAFSIDFTALASKNKLDPVIGRQEQIQRMTTILNRRTKNNPVLIGEPGVGKTAIVEGLAQKIIDEDVPTSLLDKRVISLDLSAMIAGTKYRGEFEDRFKRIMKEIVRSKNIILFIDEMHLLVGAGAAEGAIDAGNILKPTLARGEIQVIGATTTAEYTKYIERDAALERRFQPIIVPETTVPETKQVLRGISQRYADYHQIDISDEIIDQAVGLSDRYINDRYLPDKAIDLLDEAAAYARITTVQTDPAQNMKEKKIEHLRLKMKLAGEAEDYESAANLKNQLEDLIDDGRKSQTGTLTMPKLVLETQHLAHVVSIWTGIPVQQVLKTEAKFLLNLEQRLKRRVIGQTEAVTTVAKAIRRSRSGVSDPSRPIGGFLFLGSTGVGKTELAKVLAEEFYGRQDALVKIDMSEFSERHTVARLIGAPPGYIGYDQPGQLTEKIRRQPYSLILFDEIEKAHPDVFNLLLQILEDGSLTDAKGRKVNFTNTIIILTSNLGSSDLQKEFSLGFDIVADNSEKETEMIRQKQEQKLKKALKEFMRPELINRLDKIIIFNTLSMNSISKIVQVRIDELKDRLTEQKLGLVVGLKVKRWLAKNGYDKQNGVRPLRRLIQTEIEDRIATGLLDGRFKIGDVIQIDLNKSGQLEATIVTE